MESPAIMLDNTPDVFDTADVYSVGSTLDELTASSLAEALADYLDTCTRESLSDDAAELRRVIDEQGGFIVTAWKAVPVSESWAEDTAEELRKLVAERFDEPKGKRAGAALASLEERFALLLSGFVVESRVAQYSIVEQRTFGIDETWTLMCPYYGHERGVE